METMLIGIPDMGPDPFRIYMFGKYAAGVRRSGGEVEKLPWGVDDDNLRLIVENWDGLLLPGGPDIDPALYGEKKEPACGEPNVHRDDLELRLLRIFLETGKPILGICRGMQLINVFFGGSLIQHLPSANIHRWDGQDQIHPADCLPGSLLSLLYGSTCLINSAHHQGVRTAAPGLTVTQTSPDGVIEGLEHSTMPVLGVQWHPERTGMSPRRTDLADGGILIRYFAEHL